MKLFRFAFMVAVGSLGALMARYLEHEDPVEPLQRQIEAELQALRDHLFGR
ncbi:MAG: hypothetical protein ACREQ4_09725 [Candidatus Binataceae bacterium]